ncbi:hypothetical protein EGI22_11020 [Lacihabitans sp. LS3-19]|uniref:hypothetical protein n=1 Tax=Lacihabitans sp. LS3-19 TaxID=2487335 RepID=UPI0020CB94F1|nr:hypothetical protein [Lacihabitans sp. LS3-19]MCP9768446.1 hypothetical protein [Lacihabitans sp. LS3-19]
MEKIDIFDDYLKDKMPAKERELFEINLAENGAMKEAFLNYQTAVELLKYNGLKNEVKKAHSQFSSQKAKKIPFLKIAAAMVFGLLSISTFWIGNTNGSDLLAELPIQYIEPQHRGANEEKVEAELRYLNKDFDGVVAIFNSSKTPNEKLDFLAIMSYYNLKNYAKAIDLITKIENQQLSTKYANEYEFYMCQSLLGINKYSEALKNIKKMDEKNPYKATFNWKYMAKIKILALKERLF